MGDEIGFEEVRSYAKQCAGETMSGYPKLGYDVECVWCGAIWQPSSQQVREKIRELSG